MYFSYIEIEYVATSFSPTRTDLALKLLNACSTSGIALDSVAGTIPCNQKCNMLAYCGQNNDCNDSCLETDQHTMRRYPSCLMIPGSLGICKFQLCIQVQQETLPTVRPMDCFISQLGGVDTQRPEHVEHVFDLGGKLTPQLEGKFCSRWWRAHL
jgi:hypothetical protein